MNEVYVVAATRTPVGKAGRMFSQVRADDLLAAAHRLEAGEDELHGLLERCGFSRAT